MWSRIRVTIGTVVRILGAAQQLETIPCPDMCCDWTTWTKRSIVSFRASTFRLPGMALQPFIYLFFQSLLLSLFDQSNQINSALDSPADLVSPAHELSKKHVRDVPPASSDTTQASSACTDLIRNTMPFIFCLTQGDLQASGSWGRAAGHFPFSYFSVCLSLPSTQNVNATFSFSFFSSVYFAWLPFIDC